MRRFAVAALALLACLPAAAWAQDQTPLSRIAFGSCADQGLPQPIWVPILATKPQLFLFIGDNIYGDTHDMKKLEARYRQLAKVPGYQLLLKTCPVLATWDDHDYGINDAGADYPRRRESQQLFLDFFGVPKDSPRRKQEGVYHAEVFGPPGKRVQVILLDTRYFRGPLRRRPVVTREGGRYLPNTDPAATVLGEAQWAWLKKQLETPAELRLVCSSIQVVPEDHGYEKWMNFPRERERLFRLIRETKAAGVIFLSGDRHLAELSLMDGGAGYPLYDLTSSGLNKAYRDWRPHEVNRHRVASMNQGDNFGLITIDWGHKAVRSTFSIPNVLDLKESKDDPLITLQIRDDEGEIVLRQKVLLSNLRPRALEFGDARLARLSTGEPLTRAEAAKHVNQKVTVELKVRGTGASKGGLVFLNSLADRTLDGNFTVVLDKAALALLRGAGVESPQEYYDGKSLRVTGTLTLFREQPQIVVIDPAQITVVVEGKR